MYSATFVYPTAPALVAVGTHLARLEEVTGLQLQGGPLLGSTERLSLPALRYLPETRCLQGSKAKS